MIYRVWLQKLLGILSSGVTIDRKLTMTVILFQALFRQFFKNN